MDKQMIEEMAEIISRDCGACGVCKHNTDHEKGIDCTAFFFATELYNAGYRKIPEGVVLTESKEELLHEMYEQGKFDAMADLEKDGKVVLTREEYDELKKCEYNSGRVAKWLTCFDEKEREIRKEISEKFAERLKTECFDGGIDEKWVTVSFSRLDEICKEITEGKDDDTSEVGK